MEGDREDKGEGARGNRERDRHLSEGVKQEQKLQNTRLLFLTTYNPVLFDRIGYLYRFFD